MLKITIPGGEYFNEETGEFINIKGQTLELEHSLVSLSKWESKWHKPFLTKEEKTVEEITDYIRCMTVTPNVKNDTYTNLTNENIAEINAYIENPMTATTVYDDSKQGSSREIITSELIYYWMIASNIPFECQKWHLNRLLTLIRICEIKNEPPKKMSKGEIMSRNRSLNAARKKRLNTHG